MGQTTIDEVTTATIDRLRKETGAQTRGEVIRNAMKAYLKEIAAEKKALAEVSS
jgi:metal-responsive CopG/Arc/MetJ family transcriptional regulator